MLKEQLRCLGRIAGKYQISDDAIWQIVKEFDIIYQKMRKQSIDSTESNTVESNKHKLKPHPGILHLIDRLDTEIS